MKRYAVGGYYDSSGPFMSHRYSSKSQVYLLLDRRNRPETMPLIARRCSGIDVL
jgi:hypothetical protein